MNRRNLKSEDGWVLVSAIVLMAIMLTVGIAAYAFVDTGQKRSRESRERESALSLAEGALYAQGFALTRNWPNPGKPLTGDCSSATAISAANLFCPDRDTLAAGSSGNAAVAQFKSTDFLKNATWTTSVRDNSGVLSAAYDPTKADSTLVDPVKGACPTTPCRMDWNEDRQLWVQARAVVRGRPRNIVARLKLEELPESVPRAAVVAGGINVSNSGNNNIIDGSGSTVIVRCNPPSSRQCVNSDPGQITPAPQTSATQPPLMTPTQLQRFKERAIADGRYYAGCPTQDPVSNQYDLWGAVVWVEDCQSPPNLANNVRTATCAAPTGMSPNCINTIEKPGLLIWHCGRADFQGSFTYVGVIYNTNNSDGTCANFTAKTGNCFSGNQRVTANDLIVTDGGFGVVGALAIDGGGCLQIGSNGLQVKFDPNAFNAVSSYGTVGLVQNTWRELKAG
jgi:Tfp pilus assembly protein PilX